MALAALAPAACGEGSLEPAGEESVPRELWFDVQEVSDSFIAWPPAYVSATGRVLFQRRYWEEGGWPATESRLWEDGVATALGFDALKMNGAGDILGTDYLSGVGRRVLMRAAGTHDAVPIYDDLELYTGFVDLTEGGDLLITSRDSALVWSNGEFSRLFADASWSFQQITPQALNGVGDVAGTGIRLDCFVTFRTGGPIRYMDPPGMCTRVVEITDGGHVLVEYLTSSNYPGSREIWKDGKVFGAAARLVGGDRVLTPVTPNDVRRDGVFVGRIDPDRPVLVWDGWAYDLNLVADAPPDVTFGDAVAVGEGGHVLVTTLASEGDLPTLYLLSPRTGGAR